MTLSASADIRPAPSGGAPAFRTPQAASFAAALRQAGGVALSTGRRLAERFPAGLSAGVDRMADGEEVLKGYLLLIHAFLEDPDGRETLDRFLNSVNELLDGAWEGDVDAVLRRIFGGEGGATRLSGAVAAFVSRLRASVSIREGGVPGEGEMGESDPLVLDLGGDGIRTTGLASGVGFDITGDGRSGRVSFVSGDDALLALDRNGNGVIDDGRELFGDQNGAANGFLELARYDGNQDGSIDAQDAVYDRLRVFQDLNGDGVSQAEEVRGLKEAGVAAIGLRFEGGGERTGGGDRIAQRSFFVRSDGAKGQTADLLLRYRYSSDGADRRRVDVRG